jgi:hypothetical protein
MEFTDPKVAGQLLEDLEEKEEQLALAAEFSAGLLARTEELAVENEAIQSEAEAAKALAAESQAALEASRLELLAKEAEMEERLREIAEATAEAMAEQLELSEGVPPRTDRSALLTGEGEGEYFLADATQMLGNLEEATEKKARRAAFLDEVYAEDEPESQQAERSTVRAPAQLQPLVSAMGGFTARPECFRVAMRAAALRVMKRDDEIDSGELAQALESCGVLNRREMQQVEGACAFLLQQVMRTGVGQEQLGQRLLPLGFSDELVHAIADTSKWLRDAKGAQLQRTGSRSFKQADTVDPAAEVSAQMKAAALASVKVELDPDDALSPVPSESVQDSDEDGDQEDTEIGSPEVLTDEHERARQSTAAKEAKVDAELRKLAPVVDEAQLVAQEGPWTMETVVKASKFPLIDAALKLLGKHLRAEQVENAEIDALEGWALSLWEGVAEDADEVMLPLLTRWLRKTVQSAVDESSAVGRAEAPTGFRAQLSGTGLDEMSMGAIARFVTDVCKASRLRETDGCTLRCTIPTTETKGDKTTYVASLSAVGGPQLSWKIAKRYSDFHQLRQTLQAALEAAGGVGGPPVPSLPPKHWIGNVEPQVIEARRIDLEVFLQECLRSPYIMGLVWVGSSGKPGPVMHSWLSTPAELRGTLPPAPAPAPPPKQKSKHPSRDRFLEDGASAGGSVFQAEPEPELQPGAAAKGPVMTMDQLKLDAVQIVERKDDDGWTSDEREVVVEIGVGGMAVFDDDAPPGLLCYFPAPTIASAMEGTTNKGQTKTCEVTMEILSSEASALKNHTSPGGRDKVKMLFCMEAPGLLSAAVLQTIKCGVAEPPASVQAFFTRAIKAASEAPVPGSATWQPDKDCSTCNGCQVAFQGNMKSLSAKLSKKGAHAEMSLFHLLTTYL